MSENRGGTVTLWGTRFSNFTVWILNGTQILFWGTERSLLQCGGTIIVRGTKGGTTILWYTITVWAQYGNY